jgi:hypothetical protein
MRVLHQKQVIRAKPLLALIRNPMLNPERLAVAHAPEIANLTLTH